MTAAPSRLAAQSFVWGISTDAGHRDVGTWPGYASHLIPYFMHRLRSTTGCGTSTM
jgi:hypothetical protein